MLTAEEWKTANTGSFLELRRKNMFDILKFIVNFILRKRRQMQEPLTRAATSGALDGLFGITPSHTPLPPQEFCMRKITSCSLTPPHQI